MPGPGKTGSIPDAAFTDIVKTARSYKDISDAIGVVPGGTTTVAIKRRISRMQLDISHFRKSGNARKPLPIRDDTLYFSALRRLSDAEFTEIVQQVDSFNQLARAIGMASCHSHFSNAVRKRAATLGLDINHFSYVKPDKENGVLYARKTESLLKRDAKRSSYSKAVIKKRLIDEGLMEERCAHCGTGPEWIGRPMELALHCKNLDYSDMRLDNLEIVCWNCRFVLTYELFSARGRNAAVVKRENYKRRKFQEILNEK